MEEIDHVCYHVNYLNDRGYGPLIRFKRNSFIWYPKGFDPDYLKGNTDGLYNNQSWATEYIRIDNNELLQILYGVTEDEINYMYSLDI